MSKIKQLLMDLESYPEYRLGWEAYESRQKPTAPREYSIRERMAWDLGYAAAQTQETSL